MKKSLANQICKLWNENFAGSYEPTRTKAVVEQNGASGEYSVEIYPDENNVGNSFHHNEELADVMRAFKVSAYLITKVQDNGDVIIIGRIF